MFARKKIGYSDIRIFINKNAMESPKKSASIRQYGRYFRKLFFAIKTVELSEWVGKSIFGGKEFHNWSINYISAGQPTLMFY